MSYSREVAPADVLIITVTPEETQAVLDAVEQLCPPRTITNEHTPRGGYTRLGDIAGAQVVLTVSRMGSGGAGNSQDTAIAGILDYRPGVVIAVGIAYGVDPNRQKIGDILLAERLFLWSENRIDQRSILFYLFVAIARLWGWQPRDLVKFRGDWPATSPTLLSTFVAAGSLWNRQPSGFGQVHQGTLASGGTLINSAALRDFLRGQTTNMIGGEMEGHGLYGIQGRAIPKADQPDWIIVKGICDWANKKNVPTKETDQRLAARNAASFLITVLLQGEFIKYGRSKKETGDGKNNIVLPIPHLTVRPPYEDFINPSIFPLVPTVGTGNFEEQTICTIGRDGRNTMVVVEKPGETTTISRGSHASINACLRQDETWEFILYPRSDRRLFLNGTCIDTPQVLTNGSLIGLPLKGERQIELLFSLYRTTDLEDDLSVSPRG